MKPPCSRDCPDRSITCHSTCERYLDYFAENEKIRKAKQREHDIAVYDIDKSNKICRIIKKRRRRKT